jgi:hypothetical protein
MDTRPEGYDTLMGDIGRGRHLVRFGPVRRVAALATACCLLASCSSDPDAVGGAEPSPEVRTAPGSPQEPIGGSESAKAQRSRGGGARGLPKAPAGDAPALASQLDRAVATLRDEDATAAELRRAGEFHQLAILVLAVAGSDLGRAVTSRLNRQTAAVTLPGVRAARQLRALTDPQPLLPSWRITAPPPYQALVDHYRDAQRRTGVPWTYLASIHLVETRMGRIRGTSTAGARGPMQFLPATWELYGAGGDINDPRDAILAAARLLRANGAPGDMAEALWHYNPSDSYVRAVSGYAHTMEVHDWAYRSYWQWRVLYRHTRGVFVLPVGYPETRPVLLPGVR